jgi:hypothetical protein
MAIEIVHSCIQSSCRRGKATGCKRGWEAKEYQVLSVLDDAKHLDLDLELLCRCLWSWGVCVRSTLKANIMRGLIVLMGSRQFWMLSVVLRLLFLLLARTQVRASPLSSSRERAVHYAPIDTYAHGMYPALVGYFQSEACCDGRGVQLIAVPVEGQPPRLEPSHLSTLLAAEEGRLISAAERIWDMFAADPTTADAATRMLVCPFDANSIGENSPASNGLFAGCRV